MKVSQNRIFATFFRLIGLVSGIIGLYLTCSGSGGFMTTQWVFFTVQTNIFSTVLFGVLFVKSLLQIKKEGKSGEIAHVNLSLQLAITYYITITFLVFWLVLSTYGFGTTNVFNLSCYIVHGLVPILAIVDWILFMPHGKLHKKCAFKWLSYPAAYYIFTIIRAHVGGTLYKLNGLDMRYPYFFIEPQCLGNTWLLAIVIPVTALVFWLLGIGYIALDNKLCKKPKDTEKNDNENKKEILYK